MMSPGTISIIIASSLSGLVLQHSFTVKILTNSKLPWGGGSFILKGGMLELGVSSTELSLTQMTPPPDYVLAFGVSGRKVWIQRFASHINIIIIRLVYRHFMQVWVKMSSSSLFVCIVASTFHFVEKNNTFLLLCLFITSIGLVVTSSALLSLI